MTALWEVTKESIMRMADNMAAAATTFNSHGYDSFIAAREEFKNFLKEVNEEEITHGSSIG